jgi:hypothetical protein
MRLAPALHQVMTSGQHNTQHANFTVHVASEPDRPELYRKSRYAATLYKHRSVIVRSIKKARKVLPSGLVDEPLNAV